MEKDIAHLEREFSLSQAASLPNEGFRAFVACRFTSKSHLFLGKRLILFRTFMGKPDIVETFTMVDGFCDIEDGAKVEIESSDKQAYEITHTPIELAPGVFVWLPRFTLFERYVHEGAYRSRLSVVIRSPHNPSYSLVEGAYYLVDQRKFEEISKG